MNNKNIAFGHDDADGNINPVPSTEGKWGKYVNTTPKAIALIVIFLGCLALWHHNKSKVLDFHWTSKSQSGSSSTLEGNSDEQRLILNNTDWQGMSNFDLRKKLVIDMLTRGVAWEIRPDGDDSRIEPMYPAGWKTNSVLKLPSGNLLEARVQKGQQTGQAIAIIRRVPRT